MLWFSEIIQRLSVRHRPHPDQKAAFVAKVRNLIRCGLVTNRNGGGRRANYTEADYRLFFYCAELCSLGIPPDLSVKLVAANRRKLEDAARVGGDCHISLSVLGAPTQSSIALTLPRL